MNPNPNADAITTLQLLLMDHMLWRIALGVVASYLVLVTITFIIERIVDRSIINRVRRGVVGDAGKKGF